MSRDQPQGDIYSVMREPESVITEDAKRRNSTVWRCLFAAGIAIGLLARWSFPSADPPLHRQTGAILFDEVWGFAARNGALWGAWEQDEWRPWVVCPVHTFILEASFHTFGITPFGLRLPAMLGSSLILAYVFAMARVARFSATASLAASFVLATSWTMTGFGKCMTLEPTLVHFFGLSMLFLFLAESRARGAIALYAAAGLCAGLAALCKTSGIPMALSLVPYLLLGAVAQQARSAWRWRVLRTATFSIAFGATVAWGFWTWMLPNYESFYSLTIQTAFLDRAQNPLLMRAYKAVFWLDSQAFMGTPFWLGALLVLLPTLSWRHKEKRTRAAAMRSFAIGLSASMLLVGLALLINIDVPARRLVYFSIPLAVLTAAIWDACMVPGLLRTGNRNSRLAQALTLLAFMVTGLLLSGWIVSPNGGITSFVAPRFSAWLLFDMRAKILYKLLWLVLGIAIGGIIWLVRRRVWHYRRNVLACALIAHGVCYLIASGLWMARLSHTGLDASRKLGEHVPAGAYVLGADAAANAYFNEIRPIFWSPKVYRFANHDEDVISRMYDPEYMVLNALDVEKLRNGTHPCSAYIASFLENEIARLPLYEYHESLSLGTDLIVFRRTARDAGSSLNHGPH